MKHFTQREQTVIRCIINGAASDTYVLTNAFMDLMENKGVAFDCKKGDLQFEISRYEYDLSSMLQVEREFIETALLIKYLEDNQYIYLIKDNEKEIFPSPVGDTITTPVAKTIPKDITYIFTKCFVRIIVLNKLIDLVNNNFLTYEEQQLNVANEQLKVAIGSLEETHSQTTEAKTQTIYARLTLVAAILTFIATFFIPCCSNCKGEKTDSTCEQIIANPSVSDVDSICSQLDVLEQSIDKSIDRFIRFGDKLKRIEQGISTIIEMRNDFITLIDSLQNDSLNIAIETNQVESSN